MADKTNENSDAENAASKSPASAKASASANGTAKAAAVEGPSDKSGTAKGRAEKGKAESKKSEKSPKPPDVGKKDVGRKSEGRSGTASPRNRSWMAIGVTLGVLIALAAIYYGGPWANDTASEVSLELSSQIQDLDKRLSAVEEMMPSASATGDKPDETVQAVASLRNALEGLEKRVEAMSARSANEVPMSDMQTPSQTPDDAKLSAALDLIVTLEERVATLESGNGAIPDVPFNVTERLVRLEKVINSGLLDRISSLEEVVPDTASHDDLRDVEKRLFKLENKKDDPTVTRAAQSMAMASLSHAVLAAQPFETELNLVERLFPGANEVQVLRRHAKSGLESGEVLTRDFERLALQALREARLAKANDWSSRMWAWTQSIITIRRTDSDEGDDMEGVINRIEKLLVNGSFTEALDESEKLGAETEVLEKWQSRLKERVEAENNLKKLTALASQSGTNDQ